MKNTILILTVLFLANITSNAQKFAVVDSKYILNQMPAYKESQKKIDELIEKRDSYGFTHRN